MISGVKSTLKNLNSRRKDHLCHNKSNKSALRTLGFIENEKGPLTPLLRNKCDDYAVSVLKDKRYAPWLYAYSAFAGEFREGWLPSNYWGKIVVPKIQGVHGRVSGLKSMNRTIFDSDYFPDVLSYVNGIFVGVSGEVISRKAVKDYLFSFGPRMVFKPDNSLKSRGIKAFSADTFDSFWTKEMPSGVFQKFIVQDDGLAAFFDSAVSTLRLNTVINRSGAPELRSAHCRFGTGVDTLVADPTQIRVAVSFSDGMLSDLGYTPKWAEITHHPDSKLKFQDFAYPNFKEATEVVLRLHESVPYVQCVGWDVCVDTSGQVNIMEWNGRQNGIQFPEAVQGPCFRELDW